MQILNPCIYCFDPPKNQRGVKCDLFWKEISLKVPDLKLYQTGRKWLQTVSCHLELPSWWKPLLLSLTDDKTDGYYTSTHPLQRNSPPELQSVKSFALRKHQQFKCQIFCTEKTRKIKVSNLLPPCLHKYIYPLHVRHFATLQKHIESHGRLIYSWWAGEVLFVLKTALARLP